MANQSINCSVTQCRYHGQANSCSLPDITVGNTAPQPREKRETECGSFESIGG